MERYIQHAFARYHSVPSEDLDRDDERVRHQILQPQRKEVTVRQRDYPPRVLATNACRGVAAHRVRAVTKQRTWYTMPWKTCTAPSSEDEAKSG